MPCEGKSHPVSSLTVVTPIPFVEQQLPYNPKFIREPDIPGPGNGGSMGMGGSSVYGPGPVAAAASVLIPPSPGGQAGIAFFCTDYVGILNAD